MIHHLEDLQIIIIDNNTLEMNSTGNRDSLDLLWTVFSFVFGNFSLKNIQHFRDNRNKKGARKVNQMGESTKQQKWLLSSFIIIAWKNKTITKQKLNSVDLF